VDVEALEEAFRLVQRSTSNGGLLVVRRGWLVFERYFGRGHREATPNLASCGKSVTSLAVGMLLAERRDLFPDGLDQKVFTPRYLPEMAFPLSDPRKADIRLGQLLAMSAGIRGNNPGYVRGKPVQLEPAGPDGWPAMVDDVALGKMAGERNTITLWCDPGGGYSYATSSIHIASIMLRHVTGMELEAFVAARLAAPLGWSRWGYGYRMAKLRHTPGGGGICLRATDVLRFAYLLLREGRWSGRQIVPASYVRHCRSCSPFNPHFPYSLQFQLHGGDIPGAPEDAFWKSGSGGHCVYVVPSLDLVAFKLGGRDGQYEPADTGLTGTPTTSQVDPGWKAALSAEAADRETLRLVASAVRSG
jgi:CubicO group peptidase (beta-lactamase class C family)